MYSFKFVTKQMILVEVNEPQNKIKKKVKSNISNKQAKQTKHHEIQEGNSREEIM